MLTEISCRNCEYKGIKFRHEGDEYFLGRVGKSGDLQLFARDRVLWYPIASNSLPPAVIDRMAQAIEPQPREFNNWQDRYTRAQAEKRWTARYAAIVASDY